jgi:septum formation protein
MASRNRCTELKGRFFLASRSPSRKRLLSGLLRSSFPDLQLKFKAIDLDERELQRKFARHFRLQKSNWTLDRAKMLAQHLAHAKRTAGESKARKGDLVMGCDQVVWASGRLLGKPHSHSRAVRMLTRFSGCTIYLINGISLSRVVQSGQRVVSFVAEDVQLIQLNFAQISKCEIERVLKLDQPYESAGAFHFESHGANLLRSVKCDDPTGILGLPVMRVRRLLEMLDN